MKNDNYFDLFKLKVDESLILNPTSEYEEQVNKAFLETENRWKQLKLKHLGKKSDEASENLKRLKAHEFDILKNPTERQRYYLKIKEEKQSELKTRLIESNEEDMDLEALKKQYNPYLNESEIEKIVKEIFKAKEKSDEAISMNLLNKLAIYENELKQLGEVNLFTAFGFDEKANYETVKNKIKQKQYDLQKKYDEHPNDSSYKKYINKKDILKKFEKEVFLTNDFKDHYEEYKHILKYSMFIQLLLNMKDKDITTIYFKDILLEKVKEEGIDEKKFILFLLKSHKYFGIKGISPVTDYYIANVGHKDFGEEDTQQTLQKVLSIKDYEYHCGREALKNKEFDKAFEHFKESNIIDHSYALYELAELYYTGTDSLPRDLNRAIKLHEVAINDNNSKKGNNNNSLYRISQMCFSGEGCEKNEQVGFRHLKDFVYNLQASNDFYNQAHLDLGDCYYKGKGTAKNYKKALVHYNKVSDDTAKGRIRKIEREITYRPIIMIGITSGSYILLCLVSLYYLREVLPTDFNIANVLIYFGILFAWMIFTSLYLYINPSWLNQLIKFDNIRTLQAKIVQYIYLNKKRILTIAILLFGCVCFLLFYTGGLIKPWLTEADIGEIPEFLSLLLNYGVNWVSVGLYLIVLFPLYIIKEVHSPNNAIKVNVKTIIFDGVKTYLFASGIYYAIQWSAENVLTEFSVLKYIGITIFLLIIVSIINTTKMINRLFNGKLTVYVFAVLLLYGSLTCALVAENNGDLPIATTLLQVAFTSLFIETKNP